MMRKALFILPLLSILLACSSEEPAPVKADSAYRTEITTGMQTSIQAEIDALVVSATAIQAAAPEGPWSVANDAKAIADMKAAYLKARIAYERIEGAVAPLFGDLDTSMDQRYDAFLQNEIPNAEGDANLFDDKGVTGMHAIERVLWAQEIPPSVIAYEKEISKDGKNLYVAARFPLTAPEALEFKTKLCQKFIDDAKSLQKQWKSVALDIDAAYVGLGDLMAEQAEKVDKAATGAEESRYSQKTMADLRGNLEGTQKIFAIFKPFLVSKDGGAAVATEIENGFAKLKATYDGIPGDAIPAPPATWQAEKREKQSAADLATPFGKLFLAVTEAVDAEKEGALAHEMAHAGEKMGLKAAK
ncbi:MAG: EfeM/EfeO family lipoprotein [Polyangiaceae bacterium]